MRKIFVLLISMLIFISACQSNIINDCPDGLTKFNKVSLYFGTSTNEGIITNEEWSNFLDEIVTPNFPEGMTIHDTYGQWKRPDGGIVKEPGKVIVHIYDINEDKSENINAIINGFKERFQAQSVIWEADIICGSF